MEYQIQKYIEWKATYAPRAANNYRIHLQRFKEYIRKEYYELNLDDVIRFQNLMQDRYSPCHAAFAMIVMKNFFKFWQAQGKQIIDPYLIRVPRFTAKSHIAITIEEFKKMESTLNDTEFYSLEKHVMIRLLWETGVRISELCDLDVSHVDSQKRKALIITKKNKKERWIMWGTETHEMLLKYLGIRLCLNSQPALFIAGDIGGRRDRISVRTAQRWVKGITKDAGIVKKVSPHSFRHSKAHAIIEKGGNVVEIVKILGHSDTNTQSAFSYLRLNETEFEKVAERFLD